MTLQPRHKVLLGFAFAIFLFHMGVATFARPSFRLTILGDALPCLLLIVTILAVRENFRFGRGILPLFWKLMAAGLFQMLLSQAYWFYYDSLKVYSSPSPLIGDTLFLLAHFFCARADSASDDHHRSGCGVDPQHGPVALFLWQPYLSVYPDRRGESAAKLSHRSRCLLFRWVSRHTIPAVADPDDCCCFVRSVPAARRRQNSKSRN